MSDGLTMLINIRLCEDIKPQNILIETDKTNDVFQNAPVEAFEPEFAPMDSPNDFYMPSMRIVPAGEEFENPSGFSIRLADFGTCKYRHVAPKRPAPVLTVDSELV